MVKVWDVWETSSIVRPILNLLRKIDEQEIEKPVLTVLSFITEDQCFLGGPRDRYWLSNHAGHNNIQKTQQPWYGWKIFVTIPTPNLHEEVEMTQSV